MTDMRPPKLTTADAPFASGSAGVGGFAVFFLLVTPQHHLVTKLVAVVILCLLAYLGEWWVRSKNPESIPVVSAEDQYRARNLPPAF